MSDVFNCPGCQLPLNATPTCPHCALTLIGPDAERLYGVDQRLFYLEGERDLLLTERLRLLDALRFGPTSQTVPVAARISVGVPSVTPNLTQDWVTGTPKQPETSVSGVQNILLSLGGILLAVGAVVFGAVTYEHLGDTGRALILFVLACGAAFAPVLLLRRRLASTAETLAAVALVLASLDVWAFRIAGAGNFMQASTYTAVSLVALSAATAIYTSYVPLRVTRIAAVLFAQPVVPLLLERFDAGPVMSALALSGLAAADVAVWLAPQLPRPSRTAAIYTSGLALLGALASSLEAADGNNVGASAGFLAVAAVVALLARATSRSLRELLSGSTVVLLCSATLAVSRPLFPEFSTPLVLVCSALLLALATRAMGAGTRSGALGGAVLVGAGALLVNLEQLSLFVTGPLTWITQPWSLGDASRQPRFIGTDARAAISTDVTSHASPTLLCILLAATATAFASGLLHGKWRSVAFPSAGLLGLLAAGVAPTALGASYPVALVLLVVLTASLVVVSLIPGSGNRRTFLHFSNDAVLLAAFAPAALVAIWSLADETATITVIPWLAVLAAIVAADYQSFRLLPDVSTEDGSEKDSATSAVIATALALLLCGAEVVATGFAYHLSQVDVGVLLIGGTTVSVLASFALRNNRRVGAEIAAAALSAISIVLAIDDTNALFWTLAAGGVLSLAISTRVDRRALGIVGALLVSSSSWVRLAAAGVHAPEPYVLPLAVAVLAFGYFRRRTHKIGSFEAYGSGLALALVPVLLRSMYDESPLRGLLLLAAGAVVVTLGARFRLRAPLLIGGAVIVVDALVLLGPYAAALPRWSVIVVIGLFLLTVGATYEKRRRDVERLREKFSAWA